MSTQEEYERIGTSFVDHMPSLPPRRLRAVGQVACEWICFTTAVVATFGLFYLSTTVPGALIANNITTEETLIYVANILIWIMFTCAFGGMVCFVCIIKFRHDVLKEEKEADEREDARERSRDDLL